MAERIARGLNRLVDDDLDFLSDDRSTLLELIDEYLEAEEQEEVPASEEIPAEEMMAPQESCMYYQNKRQYY